MLPDSEEEWTESSHRGQIPFPTIGEDLSVTYTRLYYVDTIVEHINKSWLSLSKEELSKATRKEAAIPDLLFLGKNSVLKNDL